MQEKEIQQNIYCSFQSNLQQSVTFFQIFPQRSLNNIYYTFFYYTIPFFKSIKMPRKMTAIKQTKHKHP